MKILFLVIFLYFTISVKSFATDTCKVGMFLNSLTDFNLKDKSITANFWLWQQYNNDSLHFQNTTEVVGAKQVQFLHFSKNKGSAYRNWNNVKVNAVIQHNWDVQYFPFDKQQLRIVLEDALLEERQLYLDVDAANSKVSNDLKMSDFVIENFTIKSQPHKYETTYGNPDIKGSSSYNSVVATISIKRKNSWRILLLSVTGLIIAFSIGISSFKVGSKQSGARLNLCVGSLFSAVGSKYVSENIVPAGNSWTLLGNLHNLTFVCVFLIIITTIKSIILIDNGKIEQSEQIDKKGFAAILSLFTIALLLLIGYAAWL